MTMNKNEDNIKFTVKTIIEFETDGKKVRLEYGNPENEMLHVDVFVNGIKKDLPDYLTLVKVNSIHSNKNLVLDIIQDHEMFGILN